MSKRITICAGIDTGKRKLDVALEANRERLEVDNNSAGHQAVAAWLRRRSRRAGRSGTIEKARRSSRKATPRTPFTPLSPATAASGSVPWTSTARP